MKNVIEYYYGLRLNDIHQKDGNYTFNINNKKFVFMPYTRNLEEIEDLSKIAYELLNRGIPVHQFVSNINNNFLTFIPNNNTFITADNILKDFRTLNGKYYIMLQIYNDEKRKITIDDIINFSNLSYNIYNYNSLIRNNWSELWSNKIDYFEYQINQFGKNKQIIRDSFPFYSGIVENGISFFNTLDLNNMILSVQHKRITDDIFDFYNPLNFIIDYRIRDACEYYKIKLNKNIGIDILEYLKKSSLNKDEIYLFYDRLLYASFYFDKYEEAIVSDTNDFEEQKKIALDYENLLNYLYKELSKHILMPDIWWLNKKT